ncbi:hypothetical protein QOZ80_5AG0376070 [Eleusine coracana subsp. coracana]|nr:hypothetical protein QOZ80_5AG0376070 [Eleusine coracana subsp. coracana]
MAADRKVVSPLHKVIDAVRWDAEGLLGRLIIFIHAVFLDGGFVPLPLDPSRKRGPQPQVSREAGRTASSLSLRPVRDVALGAGGRARRRAAPVGRARRHVVSEGLCRRALVHLCREWHVPLEPTFASLPDDAKGAILARLKDDGDLAIVQRTCTALRRLVADRDRELWKPRLDALVGGCVAAPDSPEETSS